MEQDNKISRRTNVAKDQAGGAVALVAPSERERPFVEADMEMRELEHRIGRTPRGDDFVRRVRAL